MSPTDQRDIPYYTTSWWATNTQREEKRDVFVVMVFTFPSNLYCLLSPCFPESCRKPIHQWQIVNKFLFLLCLCMQLLPSLIKTHYIDPWISLSFLHSLWERGLRKHLGGSSAVGQGQPTAVVVDFFPCMWFLTLKFQNSRHLIQIRIMEQTASTIINGKLLPAVLSGK